MPHAPRYPTCVVLIALLCLGACRDARTLDEIEDALGEDTPPLLIADEDERARPFLRVRRLFAPMDAPVFEPVVHALSAGEYADRGVSLTRQDCYTFLAVDRALEARVDIALQTPEGRVVASDTGADSFPVIQGWCPEEDGRYTLRVIAPDESADVEFGAFRADETRLRAMQPRLAELVDEYAVDSRAIGPLHRETLLEGESYRVPLYLERGRCHAVVAVGDGALDDVDAALYNSAGERLRQDVSTNTSPVIERFCPETTGLYPYEIRAYRGDGEVFWQLRAW